MSFRFDNYLLDIEQRRLLRSGEVVALEPLAFDLLEFLVRNHYRIVSKDDLIAEVWRRKAVADSTLSSRIAAVRKALGDDGQQQRLVRTISRRGFQFVGAIEHEPAREVGPADAARGSPGRAGIAVLPFAHISEEANTLQHLVKGIVEDITTGLAHHPWLTVVARSSSCAHGDWGLDIRQVTHELGVRYALEGSVRCSGNRLRVTARLIDAVDGTQLWADRFDEPRRNSFALQDQITARVVGSVSAGLERFEIDRARRTSPERATSIDCFLRGMGGVYQWSERGISDALLQFRKAIELDPEFAAAHAMAAYCYIQRKSYGWMADRTEEIAACLALAHRAAELANGDAGTIARAAHATASVAGDVDSGAVLAEQALRLNPNLAIAWYVSGWIQLFLGKPGVAGEHLLRGIRVNPFDPLAFKMQAGLAYVHFFTGRYDDALVVANRVLQTRPVYLTAVRAAAASHALAGRVDDAHRLLARMHERDPGLRLSTLSDLIPFRRSQDFSKWADALHVAGLPD